MQDLAYRPDRRRPPEHRADSGPRLDPRRTHGRDRGARHASRMSCDGTALEVLPCSGLGPLPGGEHRLIVLSTDRFAVTSTTMTARHTVETTGRGADAHRRRVAGHPPRRHRRGGWRVGAAGRRERQPRLAGDAERPPPGTARPRRLAAGLRGAVRRTVAASSSGSLPTAPTVPASVRCRPGSSSSSPAPRGGHARAGPPSVLDLRAPLGAAAGSSHRRGSPSSRERPSSVASPWPPGHWLDPC